MRLQQKGSGARNAACFRQGSGDEHRSDVVRCDPDRGVWKGAGQVAEHQRPALNARIAGEASAEGIRRRATGQGPVDVPEQCLGACRN